MGTEELFKGRSAVIIDDDSLMLELVRSYCLDLGFEEIAVFASASAGWKAMEERPEPFDFIITDWQMPGLSGVGLFNKIKSSSRYSRTPVLIISGFIEKKDFALLEDYPLSSLLEKPFTRPLLQTALEDLLKENIWFEKNEDTISEILIFLQEDPKQATERMLEALRGSPDPIGFGVLLGRRLREMQFHQSAKTVLTWVIKKAPRSIMAMTECARVFKETGNLKEALEILDITNNISPENIERLCLTGEINLELSQPETAKEVFDKVLDIDAENEVAKAGTTISENLGDHLLHNNSLDLPNSFAGVLNLLAIEKVRNGKYGDGLEQYESALVFVKDPTVAAKLKFNRGLGFLKWGKKDLALEEFRASAELGGIEFQRSKEYVERIEAIINGIQAKDPFLADSNFEATPIKIDQEISDDDVFDDSYDDELEMGIFAGKGHIEDVGTDIDLGTALREDENSQVLAEDLLL